MILFFRKLRQQLLSQNRVTKYLLYAFGEIVLVVIGILIALQINNWNEAQKQKQEEQKVFKALQTEIENNLIQLKETLAGTKTILENSTKVIKENNQTSKQQLQVAQILETLGYNTNKFDTSIVNEILGTNTRALISNDSILHQVRLLKKAYANAEKTQFYADAFWNKDIISYFAETGLGAYFPFLKDEARKKELILVDDTFYSLVGLMNGYQQSLLYSREDLQEALETCLLVLKKHK